MANSVGGIALSQRCANCSSILLHSGNVNLFYPQTRGHTFFKSIRLVWCIYYFVRCRSFVGYLDALASGLLGIGNRAGFDRFGFLLYCLKTGGVIAAVSGFAIARATRSGESKIRTRSCRTTKSRGNFADDRFWNGICDGRRFFCRFSGKFSNSVGRALCVDVPDDPAPSFAYCGFLVRRSFGRKL